LASTTGFETLPIGFFVFLELMLTNMTSTATISVSTNSNLDRM